ncbi:hypothetical protein SAMN05421690_100556 [Nitrosomonas sp. Nm51]|uniref:hypothetical protein n=1 Tax=Nitrosomonas sp. Nm51 TaxID=133720 RepID=UPI0008CF0F46|nr:hypothetical protein [Nitrosomonas sp. Nm51]SEQ99802.1 hypothetical protein SAMN05421690_100556 [Nitrosomonas sp. Nm51]
MNTMDAAEKKRKTIIGLALAVTLIAVVLVEDEEEMTVDTAQPVAPKKTTRTTVEKSRAQTVRNDSLDVDQLGRRKFDPQAGELFATTTWAPKRPQISPQQQAVIAKKRAEAEAEARAKAAPPAPTPPPLQFKYIGKAIQGNKIWVFLAQDGENYIARIGEKIDAQYRLDTVNDESVTLTYLPLNAKQTLTINDQQTGKF